MLGKIFPSIKKAEEDSAGLDCGFIFLVKLTAILSQFFQSVKVGTYFFFTSDFCHFPQNSVFTLIYSYLLVRKSGIMNIRPPISHQKSPLLCEDISKS